MLPEFKTIRELVEAFPDEKSCHQYIAGRRWEGFMECPHEGCDGEEAYVFKDGIRYKCKLCKKQYNAIKGTIFENSNLSLIQWFMAMHIFRNTKGITSVQLADDIGCTQPSAWFVLQRIRRACSNVRRTKIKTQVAVDVTYVGGKQKNRHFNKRIKYAKGRGFPDKTSVFGMMDGEGKLRAEIIQHESKREIRPIIFKNVELGAVLVTDEFRTYKTFERHYDHVIVNHKIGQYVKDGYSTNSVENFWSQLKRKIYGLHHYVSRKHLNLYLQETVFKFNNRHLSPQELFDQILKQSTCRIKLKDLILQ